MVKKDEKAVSEVPSLEKRIQKVEDLSMLIEKWRKLTETRRNFQTFSLGADGMGATIFLLDASGKEFKTSNTPVVSAVIWRKSNQLWMKRCGKLKNRSNSENVEVKASHFFGRSI